MENTTIDLPTLFGRAAIIMEEQRQTLNQADEGNHNHGDHMVEIFEIATQAAEGARAADMPEAMQRAAGLLGARSENGSAQVYARGLAVLASQFEARGIELDDLVPYVRNYLKEKKEGETPEAGQGAPASEDSIPEASADEKSIRGVDVLKALLAALAEWSVWKTTISRRVRGMQMGANPAPGWIWATSSAWGWLTWEPSRKAAISWIS